MLQSSSISSPQCCSIVRKMIIEPEPEASGLLTEAAKELAGSIGARRPSTGSLTVEAREGGEYCEFELAWGIVLVFGDRCSDRSEL